MAEDSVLIVISKNREYITTNDGRRVFVNFASIYSGGDLFNFSRLLQFRELPGQGSFRGREYDFLQLNW